MTDVAPVGDPEGMRALAARWQQGAARLDELGAEIGAAAAVDGFTGPAAARLGQHADATRQSARSLAAELEALVGELLADARVVEELQAEAERAAAAAAASAAAAATAAAEVPAAAPLPDASAVARAVAGGAP